MKIRTRLAAVVLGLVCALPTARADDIDIYINQTPDPTKPPLTVLMLDLNLDPAPIVCNNIFLGNSAACVQLQGSLTLQDALTLVGAAPATVVSTVLTLSFGLVNLNSQLGSLLSSLSSTTRTLLSTAVGPTLSQISNLTLYKGFLQNLLKSLVDFRLAVMVSHNNKGTTTTSGGKTYACNFSDLASVPGKRASTAACSNGGYVYVGFLDLLNDPLKTSFNLLSAKLATLGASIGASLHPYQGKELYAELQHYLSGTDIYNGHLGYFDYGDNNAATNLNTSMPLLSWDSSIESGSKYKSALDQFGSCDSVNVLNVMFTNSAGDNDSDADVAANFPGADLDGNGTATFAELVSRASSNGFLHKGNIETLRSYFLLNGASSDATLLNNLGQSVVAVPSLINLFGLGASAAQYLQPVLIVNASLLTPSRAVDLSQPGKTLDSAFFSGFKPAAQQRPAWSGNLKKLKVDGASSALAYKDANNKNGVATDGRIDTSALTFWTNAGTLGSLGADGREVTLGGAGANIPGFSSGNLGRKNSDGKRKLYYDKLSASGAPSLADLDGNAVTDTAVTELKTDFGAASNTESQELILHARGYDVGTTSVSKGTATTLLKRSWIHGPVLHSRPLAINYGPVNGYSSSNPDVRVVYGSGDGFLRLVRNTTTGGAQSGVEDWAFLPRVAAAQQKTLRDNVSNTPFAYGPDGAPVALVIDRSSSGGAADGKIDSGNPHDKAYVYFGMRRGGSHYYGLNLTNPDSPSLLWRIGPDGLRNSTGLVSGSPAWFSELGLSFSTPQPARLRVKEGSTTSEKYVLVFAGGYNGGRTSANARLAKDLNRGSSNLVGSDDSKGNALYIVDAVTGELLWKAKQGSFSDADPYDDASRTFQHPLLADSIPSDVSLTDTDGDGYADRLYVGDSGGRLWRADLKGADRNDWMLSPLASVGRHKDSATNTVAEDRRFFHAPDYVPIRSLDKNYDVIVFASGDREDPLNKTTVNWLYAYRDAKTQSSLAKADVIKTESALKHQADFTDLTTTCGDGSTVSCADISDLATGWRIKLPAGGEKSLSQPLTLAGTVFLSTFVPPDPAATQCVPSEGSGKLYAVSLNNGRAVYTQFASDGDGDSRSTRTNAPGLTGEVTLTGLNTVTSGTESLEASVPKYYEVYWRERRGDDEKPQ